MIGAFALGMARRPIFFFVGKNLFVYVVVYYNMKQVDKVLVASSFGLLLEWGRSEADRVIREFEMGLDFDFSALGEGRRKVLRMELVKRGYSVVEGRLVRLKSGRLVA